jgi:kynurenine formamidase
VADLTHPLTPDFPSFFGKAFEMETQLSRDNCGFMLLRVSYAEHVGTHFDAPLHFSENGTSIDEIPLEQLICPLVVIDVREQSEKDHDYRLGVADIERFESLHGLIPDGSCVAMYSGWEKHLGSERFMNRDTSGVFHFPGFDDAAAAFLIHERQVAGIAVDTLSLDFGAATTSPVHNLWLPSGRYGIENVANLGLLPPLGATLIGGAPKIEGGTGGPGRVLALY